MIYIIMFIIALLSGSLLPIGSEALLIYYIKSGYSITILLFSATIGNILGSVVNYYLGIKGEKYLISKNYLNSAKLNRAKRSFNRYGGYSLLLSSLPIIGDPLTFIAGILEYDFKRFIIFVSISKFVRYIFITIITLGYF